MTRRKILVLVLAMMMVLGTLSPVLAFSDTKGKWSEGYVDWATEKGYLKGYPDGTFKPNEKITKVEFYAIVNRMAGATTKAHVSYADVKDDKWFYDDVAKGVAMGYLKDDVYYHYPERSITREEACRILAFVYEFNPRAEEAYGFKDSSGITYKGEVGALVNKGIINGYPDGSFKPEEGLSRSEVAKIITVAETKVGKPRAFVDPDVVKKERPGRGYYYCDYPTDEIKALQKAVDSGKAYLRDKASYTEASIKKLESAVERGQDILDNYRDWGRGNWWYDDLAWYDNWTDFYRANKNKGYRESELRDIWDGYGDYGYCGNCRDGKGWYGWYEDDDLTWYGNRRDFINENAGKGYSRAQLGDIWDYGWNGWGRGNCANYTASEIDEATWAIDRAIMGLVKVTTTTPDQENTDQENTDQENTDQENTETKEP